MIASRSSEPVDFDEIRLKAHHAGAPVGSEADRLAARLAQELADGGQLSRNIETLLRDALLPEPELPHEQDRMKLWAGATQTERAEALEDLLGLGDALPFDPASRESRRRFPRINSGP